MSKYLVRWDTFAAFPVEIEAQNEKEAIRIFKRDAPHSLLRKYDVVCEVSEDCDSAYDEDDDYYTPSSTAGDYSPSAPWLAPGMSVSDFI